MVVKGIGEVDNVIFVFSNCFVVGLCKFQSIFICFCIRVGEENLVVFVIFFGFVEIQVVMGLSIFYQGFGEFFSMFVLVDIVCVFDFFCLFGYYVVDILVGVF